MQTGDKYIKCIRNCGLMKCADDETQHCSSILASASASAAGPVTGGSSGGGFLDSSNGNGALSTNSNGNGNGNGNGHDSDLVHCTTKPDSIKWCRQYAIEQALEQETLGFIPRTYYCHDERGKFTQQPGKALKRGFLQAVGSPKIKLGDCEYENRLTKVERYEVGPYTYCTGKISNNGNANGANNGAICDDTFDGGYRSRDYDPRYRGWYIQTKQMQVPNWSPPYPFFSQLDLGITYSHPIYTHDKEADRHIFDGVLAVDYTFEDIGKFLVDGYKDSATRVVVYEEDDPNFIVASSTGRKAASKVLEADPDQPCPDDAGEQSSNICIVVRDSMKNLQGYHMDDLLVRAYQEQKQRDYPRELLTVKGSSAADGNNNNKKEEELYVVQSSFYRPGGDLNWIVLVISPAGEGTADALTKDNPLFGVVCVIAAIGFCFCLSMFYLFYRQRHERAVILADWRFTSAFLLGCALLNLSSFTLLGENTDTLCLLRMWSFHFLFALALSPLFVKVWRMWRMVGAPNRQPAIVNHTTAAMLSLPIVAFQVLILTIFTFADPPRQEEIIDIEDGIVTQRIVCTQDSRAFMIVMITYEAGLVLIGCVLAYVTRNLDTQFGEAKQLMFSMYNIAFIGVITTVIIYTMDIDATGQIVLSAIGVFWGTFFSSAAFVLPRLLRVKEEKKMMSGSIMKKSQKGTGTSAHRASKVRFSMDDDSSLHSENNNRSTIDTRSQATDKKSNLSSSRAANGKDKVVVDTATALLLEERPESMKQDSLRMPSSKESRNNHNMSGSNGMGDDSFFVRGTGWSVYEQSDPNALLGRWSAQERSEEFNDEGVESAAAGGGGDGSGAAGGAGDDRDNTARTVSEEDSPSNNAMSTIEELDDSSGFDDVSRTMSNHSAIDD